MSQAVRQLHMCMVCIGLSAPVQCLFWKRHVYFVLHVFLPMCWVITGAVQHPLLSGKPAAVGKLECE